MIIKRGFPSQTNENSLEKGTRPSIPIGMGSERRHSARVSVFGRCIAHLKIFTNIYRGPCTGGWLARLTTTKQVRSSRQWILFVRGQTFARTLRVSETRHRVTQKDRKDLACQPDRARKCKPHAPPLPYSVAMLRRRDASPDVGLDKNVANHGLPVRGAASLIALPLERLRRNARAGLFFVSSMLSA